MKQTIMNMQTRRAVVFGLAILAVAAMVAPAKAEGVLVLVKSRPALDGDDVINWAQLGPSLTIVNTPATVTSNGGLSATVSNLSASSLITARQGNPWEGNFAPNAPIIVTGQYMPSGSISITFAAPVYAVGAQMGYNWQSPVATPFTEVITAYDAEGNLLGTFTVQGEMDNLANNSAVFIGIRDSVPEISTVVFSTTSTFGGYPGSIAINNVALAVPAACDTSRK
ncbi:MAG: hypothetical protein ABSG56_38520 [Bryobacteraceae bacterium]|jgi:hypothetical protein